MSNGISKLTKKQQQEIQFRGKVYDLLRKYQRGEYKPTSGVTVARGQLDAELTQLFEELNDASKLIYQLGIY